MCFEQGRSLTFPRCAIALLITKLIIYPRGHGIIQKIYYLIFLYKLKFLVDTDIIKIKTFDRRMANRNPSPKTRFTTDRPEPLTAKLSMRVTDSMLTEIKQNENWQEFVRQAIAKALEEKEELQSA